MAVRSGSIRNTVKVRHSNLHSPRSHLSASAFTRLPDRVTVQSEHEVNSSRGGSIRHGGEERLTKSYSSGSTARSVKQPIIISVIRYGWRISPSAARILLRIHSFREA